MLTLKSHDIKDFPFELYANLNDSQLEDLAKTHYLTAHNSWMLPQIAAHYGGWKLVVSELGRVNPIESAKQNITTPWHMGLWRVCTKLKRGSLVKSQVNPEFASYSALVPLILMGVKKYQGVNYSHWDITHKSQLIDKNLLEAMCWRPEIEAGEEGELRSGLANFGIRKERLLELRQQGLTVKQGKSAGIAKNPTSAWCLRGMQNTELADVPKLVGTMLTQIWVAHPSLRTEYMILDPQNWDTMPEPLLNSDIFKLRDTWGEVNALNEVPSLGSVSSSTPWGELPWEA